MRRSSLVVIAVVLVASMWAAGEAVAQQGEAIETFVCESVNNGHNECRYRSTGIVTVHVNRQMSRARCEFNQSWGTFDGGVWVDYGCRAEFVVRRPPGESSPRPTGGMLQTVTCESINNSHATCRLSGFNLDSVHIERKLSSAPCTRGVSWGVSSGENSPPGIWVDRGCRAVFAYSTQGDAYRPYGGTPHDFEFSCESLRGEWNHCEVPQVYLAQVDIIAGNDACNAYKSWGVDDTGVWVRSNCQGAFRVRYRH